MTEQGNVVPLLGASRAPHEKLFDEMFWMFQDLVEHLSALTDVEFNHVYLWAHSAWEADGQPESSDLNRFIGLLEVQEGRWPEAAGAGVPA